MKNLWRAYVNGGLPEDTDEAVLKRVRTVNAFAFVAGLFYASYLSYDVWHRPIDATLDTIGVLLMLAAIVAVRRTHDTVLASRLLVSAGFFTILPSIFFNHDGQSFWITTVFSVWAFFLVGRKQGIVWLLAYFALCACAMIAGALHLVSLAYTTNELFNIFSTTLLTTCLVYAYDRNREFYENLSRTREHELAESNVQLTDSEAHLKTALTEIKKSNEEITAKSDELLRINKLMVDRELKMIELKKQIQALGGQAT